MGRSLLGLGGNNAIIVDETANLKLASTAISFGTASQRRTTARRLIVHQCVYDDVLAKLIAAYKQVEKQIGEAIDRPSNFVLPTIVGPTNEVEIVQHETFALILHVMKYGDLDEAIDMQNAVPQGLSSSIFTTNLKRAEQFLAAWGSDCASPTSTSALVARRSAARSVARRKPAAAATPAAMPRRPTCAGR